MQINCGSAASLEAEPQRRAFPVGDWERDKNEIRDNLYKLVLGWLSR